VLVAELLSRLLSAVERGDAIGLALPTGIQTGTESASGSRGSKYRQEKMGYVLADNDLVSFASVSLGVLSLEEDHVEEAGQAKEGIVAWVSQLVTNRCGVTGR
jgi:hypothetical protein